MSFLDQRVPMKLWEKCIPEPNSGCWLWTGAVTHDGYGTFGSRVAHRQIYAALVSDVPAELQLDHRCRTRICVNPDHLEPVTARENVRRGLNGVLTTHCPRGHAYTDENTYVYVNKRGIRRRCCRACNAQAKAKSKSRMRGAA